MRKTRKYVARFVLCIIYNWMGTLYNLNQQHDRKLGEGDCIRIAIYVEAGKKWEDVE